MCALLLMPSPAVVMKHFQFPALLSPASTAPSHVHGAVQAVPAQGSTGTQQIVPTLSALTPAHSHTDLARATIWISSRAQ